MRWKVTFSVMVPAFSHLVVDAETEEEAIAKAMVHEETGEPNENEWESKLWHKCAPLRPQWQEATDFEIESVTCD